MRRALGAAIIAVAAFGTTAAVSAPAFASDDPSQPQLITSDQVAPILECSEPDVVFKGEQGKRISLKDGRFADEDGKLIKGKNVRVFSERLGPEDDACGPDEKMKCVVKHREGGRVNVRFRDEKGVLHKRAFKSKKGAEFFTKKDKHVIKWVGCTVVR
ncbi:hypothetical protein AB0L53_10265 [Nonomuraea sp. NPDC052129]|uniref:hypothetical protein n=1 Tax=Nonomuraea sp. NPDC052129 TaxID=3154651 RepID=UPI00344574A8